jgi:PLD-like domain
MTPTIRFRGQPSGEDDTAGAFLARALGDRDVAAITVVVAWARFGGLARFIKNIGKFRKRGGRLRLIVGIDEGIATVPGLELAIELADEAFAFHDSGSTFHPKIYLAEGPTKALLLVGSSNVTAGGLFSNYEASLECELSLPDDAGEEALVDANAFIDSLLADEGICLPLDRALLDRLIADPRYSISARETRTPRRQPGKAGDERDQAGETGLDGEKIFGKRKGARMKVPALSKRDLGRRAKSEPKAPPPPPAPFPVMTWTKVLTASDAQHPPGSGSNPLGNMRLTQAKNEIDWLTWFRHDLFGSAAWSERKDQNGNTIEIATVPFLVTIAGKEHGVVKLSVDHAPFRESGQSNHATVLHWDSLAPTLRRTNYKGRVLTLRRMSDGTYRLDIAR